MSCSDTTTIRKIEHYMLDVKVQRDQSVKREQQSTLILSS